MPPSTASSSTAPRSGTQSIERAALLLRELATRGTAGWSLRDLALHCELDRATVHRMLKCMVRERLVQQRAADQRYLLGPLAFELGASLPQQQSETAHQRLVKSGTQAKIAGKIFRRVPYGHPQIPPHRRKPLRDPDHLGA